LLVSPDTNNISKEVVVVGAGQAAAQYIFSLRKGGFEGRITLIGDEPHLPYQRPPLTKAFMKGDMDANHLTIRHWPWYEENQVEAMLGRSVTQIDRDRRRVTLDDGKEVAWDTLVLATGSRPRPLPVPGAELANVFELRTLADIEMIRPSLSAGRDLVIIGGGYIGLEAASTASALGLGVTVLEYAPRVLSRVTSPLMSLFFEDTHRGQGVDIRTDVRLNRLAGNGPEVSRVEFSDGSQIPAGVVLVGVGIQPNEDLARDAGIRCEDGIVVDEQCRTSEENVFAIGDCSRRSLAGHEASVRLESVHNAIEQGKIAAAATLGQPAVACDCPWFWSDQFSYKLQIAGLLHGHTDIVVRGDPQSGKFATFYLRDGCVISADAINSPHEFMAAKRLVLARAVVDPAVLADVSTPMKDILANAMAKG
jgi:3-phenylpropionate/trans-cinnamate dioxygenase ferredoxin reductase subunit